MTSVSSESEVALAGPPPPPKGFLGALAVFGERRTLVMLTLGFAAGLPNLLIYDTLSAWLRADGVSLTIIGLFALATLTYALKIFWAPLVDRTSIPVLTKLFGHRRSWMLATQAVVILGLWGISASNPQGGVIAMAGLAVLVGFFGATQDIVIDAWRIESADDSRQGAMAAAYQWGYRVAQIVAGAVPLVLAERFSWNLSYAVMAGLMLFGVAGVLLAPRERVHTVRPIPVDGVPSRPKAEVVEWIGRLLLIALAAVIASAGLSGKPDLVVWLLNGIGLPSEGFAEAIEADGYGVFVQFACVLVGLGLLVVACLPIPGFRTRPGAYLAGSFGQPLGDFFARFGGTTGGLMLALICLYRLADFVLNIMNPFYIDLGFSLTEIAEIRKVFGVVMISLGVLLGGWAVAQFGLIRTMVVGAFASPVSNVVFAWLATQGHDVTALVIAIGVDNLATGFAGTALIAYMSSLTSVGFTATQYALFSSLYALPGKLVASQSGRIVEGAARAAEGGGAFGGLRTLVAGVTPESYVAGAQTASVSPSSLGAGYIVFFGYSVVIGIGAIVLAFIVAGRHSRLIARRERDAEAQAAPA